MKKLTLLLFLASLVFFQCKKESKLNNPCDTLICANGGSCVDGSCNCPLGYTGEVCQTQVIPSTLIIEKIIVQKFPTGSFDNFSAPDIYIAISEGEIIDNNEWVSGYMEDAQTGIDLEYQGTTLTKMSNFYTVSLFDYDDPGADEAMSGIIFKPIDYVQNFPSIILLNNVSTETSIRLEVRWGL